jgi:hypothetical protein
MGPAHGGLLALLAILLSAADYDLTRRQRPRWELVSAMPALACGQPVPNSRHAARAPHTAVAWCGQAARVQRPGDQRGLLKAAPLQAPDQASRLCRAAAIKRAADIEACCWMGAAVPAHDQIELVRTPAAPGRPDALSVQGRGKARIGGHPGRAQLVEQVAQIGCDASAVCDLHVFGRRLAAVKGARSACHLVGKYGDCGGDLPAAASPASESAHPRANAASATRCRASIAIIGPAGAILAEGEVWG